MKSYHQGMTLRSMSAMIVAAVVCATPGHGAPAADQPSLAGRWTLNRELSQFPKDIGFGMDLASIAGVTSDSSSGGRGRGPSGTFPSYRESEDDAKRTKLLVDAVKNPSPHLTIAQTATAVTITDERGRSLTFIRTANRNRSCSIRCRF